jgi:plasmid maintenance system antidote protein VapI
VTARPAAAPPSPAAVILLLHRTGLSQAEAARYLAVADRTVSRWVAGARYPSGELIGPAPAHWQRLQALSQRQIESADEAIDLIEAQLRAQRGPPAAVRLVLAADDTAAGERGWPCRGAHLPVLRLVAEWCEASGIPVEIVLSGSPEAADIPPPTVSRHAP